MDYRLFEITLDKEQDEIWNGLIEFKNKMHKHLNPNDPKEPDHIWKRNLTVQLSNPDYDVEVYAVCHKDDVIGLFLIVFFVEGSSNYTDNKDLGFVNIEVLPEFRRRGIGSELLKRAYLRLKENGKKILMSNTFEEDGREFNKIVGGIEALASFENRLWMDKVDWDMIQEWIEDGKKRSPDTNIIYFNEVPEDIIDHFAEIYTETMRQVPMGELEMKPTFTPKDIRREEKDRRKQDKEKIIAITQEPDGEISGMTELISNKNRPAVLSVGLTSVREKHRGRGLGKWLKADILRKVNKEFPNTEFIATTNATSNAPMLSINKRLGFEEYRKMYNLQISMDKLAEYVNQVEISKTIL